MPSKRILLIDDEQRLSRVIETCLRKLGGWTVLTAQSGSEGLQKAQTQQPDAILLDVMMPDLDGIALFRELQENPATQAIPVILLTAKVQPVDRESYARLGVVGAIAKPFDPLQLANQIAETLGWQI
ncbi:two-component system response regulator [Chroococcidiopsis sp. CCALA 051]|uniref:response regulator n=1 Tax=Chroococcidiopsis sp. CCALA 051 TaxID=869949 RepID=UPI000D0D2259|nr:response regulator [Chroococcidiopsis sp. CCALA 051]MBE9017737.1 response regulator [Chroococcidiopsidales cyanobacterium LEGE 13417]PSM46152.1 two-component system response regulator [Chroococcidiopsis sp. CCALA 051]